ncbi:class I SAM-dependent methyltransferase [Candidatus Latescibacterota bacterium]
MDKLSLIQKFVVCPTCSSTLELKNGSPECSSCGKNFVLYDKDIPSTLLKIEDEVEFSKDKWDDYYHNEKLQIEAEKVYKESTLPIVLGQLFEYTERTSDQKSGEEKIYLEIGCGRGTTGEELAKQGWFFIGVDYSLHVLKWLKNKLDSQSIDNYLLIHGDITALPVRTESVDLIYGGGVIEHFKDCQPVVDNLYRVLKTGGISFNSVPCLNIGNMVYRSSWGSIPNVPIIKQIAEFVNIKLLKGRHMRFGYELQFTQKQLRIIHLLSGFKNENIIIDRFDYTVTLEFIKNKYLRRFFKHLIKTNRNFWQMVKVVGIKQ